MAKDIDARFDELASAMRGGFTEQRKDFGELAAMVARGFSETATKADIAEVREELSHKVDKADLEHFIGVVSSDYDSLAHRVKKLEEV